MSQNVDIQSNLNIRLNKTIIIKLVVMLALMLGIGSLPPFGQITPLGMKILGVFIGVVFGWLVFDTLWPSLFGFVALGLTGYTTILGAFGSALSNQTVIMTIFASIFAGLIEKVGCLDAIIKWIFSRKIIQKNPWVLVLGIFLLGVLGSIFNAGMAAIFLLWALVLQIAEKCGYEKKGPLVSFMLAMIVMSTITTGNCFPFKAGSIAYLGFFEPTIGASFPYVPFMAMAFSYLFIFIIVMTLIAKFVFKLDVSKFQLDEETLKQLTDKEITPLQKIALISVLVFIICMLLPSLLPKTWTLTALLSKLGLVGVIIIILVLFALLRDEQGQPVVNLAECHNSIPWSVVWILALAMPLSAAIQSPDTGIMATIMTTVTPLFSGMSVYVFMITAMVTMGLFTQVTNNMVLSALLMPVFANVCLSLNGNPWALFMMMFMVVNCAYGTPAASMQGAMVHGHEAIAKKYAYFWGITAMLVSFLLLPLICIPLSNLLM